MSNIRFIWNHTKAYSNQRKHGVSFEEAQSVFLDDLALLIEDPDHSVVEDRFILLGYSSLMRMLAVCHCYREKDSTVRIIAAREATKQEAKNYVR